MLVERAHSGVTDPAHASIVPRAPGRQLTETPVAGGFRTVVRRCRSAACPFVRWTLTELGRRPHNGDQPLGSRLLAITYRSMMPISRRASCPPRRANPAP